jgi:hypothetical protein
MTMCNNSSANRPATTTPAATSGRRRLVHLRHPGGTAAIAFGPFVTRDQTRIARTGVQIG